MINLKPNREKVYAKHVFRADFPSKKMLNNVHYSLAEKLEATCLWRRATARWLVLMNRAEYTDAQRNWIIQRRAHCQSMITLVSPETEPLSIAEFNKALLLPANSGHATK